MDAGEGISQYSTCEKLEVRGLFGIRSGRTTGTGRPGGIRDGLSPGGWTFGRTSAYSPMIWWPIGVECDMGPEMLAIPGEAERAA